MATVKQSTVVEQAEPREGQLLSKIALFNPDGTPFTGGGEGGGTTGYTGSVTVGTDVLAFEDGVLKTVTPA